MAHIRFIIPVLVFYAKFGHLIEAKGQEKS